MISLDTFHTFSRKTDVTEVAESNLWLPRLTSEFAADNYEHCSAACAFDYRYSNPTCHFLAYSNETGSCYFGNMREQNSNITPEGQVSSYTVHVGGCEYFKKQFIHLKFNLRLFAFGGSRCCSAKSDSLFRKLQRLQCVCRALPVQSARGRLLFGLRLPPRMLCRMFFRGQMPVHAAAVQPREDMLVWGPDNGYLPGG